MENSNSNNWDTVFGYILMIICTWCFNQWSSYEVWEVVWWFLGVGFVVCLLIALGIWNIDCDSPIVNLTNEIQELELEIKKAELQQDLAKLTTQKT